MAIGAAHIALVDLSDHEALGPVLGEVCYVIDLGLGIPVIELEQERVGLSAIHTWMLQQVRQDQTSVHPVPAPAALARFLQVLGSIALVVLMAVRSGTGQTLGSTLAERPIFEGKHRQWFHEHALAALLQARIVAGSELEQPDTPFRRSFRP